MVLVVGAGVDAALQLRRPLPLASVHRTVTDSLTVPGTITPLPLPATGEAALSLTGFGSLGASTTQAAVPIASVTKIVTALVVLQAHPLDLGAPGPTLTVSEADQSLYQSELAQGDSVVAVEEGESLSELQLLEGLLLPSGDNLAVLLADWVSASEPAFVERMNALASRLHLSATHFADSSGLDPGSVSSADDLVKVAQVAMESPVFAAIVAMPEVVLPVAGTVRNYNPVLGQDGVVGIKTGWTSSALGCLVFAADATIAGHQVQLIGAVLGQPGGPESGLVAAASVATALLAAGEARLRQISLPGPGTGVARLTSEWTRPISVFPSRRSSLIAPVGARLRWRLMTRRFGAPLQRHSRVGTLTLHTPGGDAFQEAVVTGRSLHRPSLWWRLTRAW